MAKRSVGNSKIWFLLKALCLLAFVAIVVGWGWWRRQESVEARRKESMAQGLRTVESLAEKLGTEISFLRMGLGSIEENSIPFPGIPNGLAEVQVKKWQALKSNEVSEYRVEGLERGIAVSTDGEKIKASQLGVKVFPSYIDDLVFWPSADKGNLMGLFAHGSNAYVFNVTPSWIGTVLGLKKTAEQEEERKNNPFSLLNESNVIAVLIEKRGVLNSDVLESKLFQSPIVTSDPFLLGPLEVSQPPFRDILVGPATYRNIGNALANGYAEGVGSAPVPGTNLRVLMRWFPAEAKTLSTDFYFHQTLLLGAAALICLLLAMLATKYDLLNRVKAVNTSTKNFLTGNSPGSVLSLSGSDELSDLSRTISSAFFNASYQLGLRDSEIRKLWGQLKKVSVLPHMIYNDFPLNYLNQDEVPFPGFSFVINEKTKPFTFIGYEPRFGCVLILLVAAPRPLAVNVATQLGVFSQFCKTLENFMESLQTVEATFHKHLVTDETESYRGLLIGAFDLGLNLKGYAGKGGFKTSQNHGSTQIYAVGWQQLNTEAGDLPTPVVEKTISQFDLQSATQVFDLVRLMNVEVTEIAASDQNAKRFGGANG